jgi:hypothetical protein
MKLREQEAKIRLHAEETSHYHYHPFKEATKNKPSETPNQSKEIATKWKEDKDNIEEANACSERLDTDIRKAILKRKTREQEIRETETVKTGAENTGPTETGRQPDDKKKHTRTVGFKEP